MKYTHDEIRELEIKAMDWDELSDNFKELCYNGEFEIIIEKAKKLDTLQKEINMEGLNLNEIGEICKSMLYNYNNYE